MAVQIHHQVQWATHQFFAEKASTEQSLAHVNAALMVSQQELAAARGGGKAYAAGQAAAEAAAAKLSAELDAVKAQFAKLRAEHDVTCIELSAYKNEESVYADQVLAAIEAAKSPSSALDSSDAVLTKSVSSCAATLKPQKAKRGFLECYLPVALKAPRYREPAEKETLPATEEARTAQWNAFANNGEAERNQVKATVKAESIPADSSLAPHSKGSKSVDERKGSSSSSQSSTIAADHPGQIAVTQQATIEFKKDVHGVWTAILTDARDPKDLLIEALQATISSKDVEIIKNSELIVGLKADLAAQEKNIAKKDHDLKFFDEQANYLLKRFAEMQDKFRNKTTEAYDLRDTVYSLKAILAAKEEEMKTFKADAAIKLAHKDTVLSNAATALTVTRTELSVAHNSLAVTQDKLKSNFAQLAVAQSTVARLQGIQRLHACTKRPGCDSCPTHMQHAMKAATSRTEELQQVLEEFQVERLKAISDLSDMQMGRITPPEEDEEIESDDDSVSETDSEDSDIFIIGTENAPCAPSQPDAIVVTSPRAPFGSDAAPTANRDLV